MKDCLDSKIRGCVIGALAGTELGMQRILTSGPTIATGEAVKALREPVRWRSVSPEPPERTWFTSLAPLLESTAELYLTKKTRITAEDWGAALAKDPRISASTSFWLLEVHSTMELLREGMNPRVSGYAAMPSGNTCMAAIPVGIYHAGDPDTAYIDGVEIASVTQRSPGSDWAALTAAAVAEALRPDATAMTVVDATLRVANRRCREVFYEMNHLVRKAGALKTPEELATWYQQANGAEKHSWVGNDPIGWALAILTHLGSQPEGALALSVLLDAYPSIRSPITGALAGALVGAKGFPEDWLKPVEPQVRRLEGLTEVVRRKIAAERLVIGEIEVLTRERRGESSLLFDKVYGCILAGAIGNAMGSVVECKHYDEIDRAHPGGITTILDPSRLEGEDDNQMAMLLTETYIERDGHAVTARDFGDTWRRKLNRDHFFYCMKNSYDLIREGMDPRIAGHWNIVTGSTVMCMEPVGTFHLCEPANAYLDATAIGYMYQRGLDVVAAAILAASVAEAFRPGATLDSVLEAALAASPRTKMVTFDMRKIDTPYAYLSRCLEVASKYTDVLAARRELYEKCLYYHMIDPLELLGLSYAMFKIAQGDVRQAAIGGTNIGRDSDTIAGRAAMLSGTLRGAGGVPPEWVAMFRAESLERIRANAGRIAGLIEGRKLDVLRGRQGI